MAAEYFDTLEYPKINNIKFIELAFKTLLVNQFVKTNKRIVFMVGETRKAEVYEELSKKFYIEVFRALGMQVDSGQVEFILPTENFISDHQYLPLSKYKFPDLLNMYTQRKNEILLDDDEIEVRDKIMSSYLQSRQQSACLEYIKLILLPWFKRFTVQEPACLEYTDFEDLKHDFQCGIVRQIHLKRAIITSLHQILQRVRVHMATQNVRKITYWLNFGDFQGSWAKLNWENRGIFSELERQTKLACWCYAIVDYLEAKYFQDHKRRIKLARQELIDNLGDQQLNGQPFAYNVYHALQWVELNGLSMKQHYPLYTGLKQIPAPEKELLPILKIRRVQQLKIRDVQQVHANIISVLQNQPAIGSINFNVSGSSSKKPHVIYRDEKVRDIGHALVLKGWDEWASANPSYLVRDPGTQIRKVKRGKFESNQLNALYRICFCDWTYIDFLPKWGKVKND